MSITKDYTFQRLMYDDRGELVLLNKEGKELGRADMPPEIFAWHKESWEKERKILGIKKGAEFDVEINLWADEQGNVGGHVVYPNGLVDNLTARQSNALARLERKARTKEKAEREIFSLLIGRYVETLPDEEPNDTETQQ